MQANGSDQTATQVIVLNGGSSSGKTSIARCLQEILPRPWLRLSVDDLIEALPPSLTDFGSGSGVALGPAGEVSIGAGFREMEAAWMAGVAAMARAGAPVILDDVFLSGAAAQERTAAYLAGLRVLWAGVRCDPAVAVAREAARGDRVTGMAATQAVMVHTGVRYDVEVDSGRAGPLDCARAIAARVS
ncbi:MAG TPA: AAA family ATPase [Streptosporangiaceae bacterium]|jgi:chloramphenicol 3-O phosphotransferase